MGIRSCRTRTPAFVPAHVGNESRAAFYRCADAHALIANLGPERLGALTELDLSGVRSVTDATLAAVAGACPLLQVLAGPALGRQGQLGSGPTGIT